MVESKVLGIQEFLSDGDYCLARGVLFIGGTLRGAICDTNTGRVFSVNETVRRVLEKSESNECWEQLVALGLAIKGEQIERKSVLPELLQKPELQFVWFEVISDDCNESCAHCYADSMPPSYRKSQSLSSGGFIPLESIEEKKAKEKLTAEKWRDLISEAHSASCKRCQFIGGEPFLYKGERGETVLDLAEYAVGIGYEFVEIFTNATLLTPEKVSRIKELGLHIAVSLYSRDPQVHDKITNTPGSHQKTVAALHMLKAADVPTRVETVLMRPNEHTLQATREFLDEMGLHHGHPDVLRPKGRGDNPALIPSKEAVIRYGLMTSPSFQADRETLSRYISGHSCLLGKITITDSGDVLPCIFSRNLIVGNVQGISLTEILTGQKLEVVWKSTKDNVLVCRDCEYRYVCFDCRPLSEGVNQGRGEYLSAPYPRCTYNPYTGEWAKGVWRLSEEGEPYYDETLRPVIQEVMSSGRLESIQPSGH